MNLPSLLSARILIVDDHRPNLLALEEILRREGYEDITCVSDPLQALPLFVTRHPDIVLLDLHMPVLDGFALLQQVRARIPSISYLPVLVLTADVTPEAKHRALSLGARDFLTKPFDASEVLLRTKNLLEMRMLHRALEDHNRSLEEEVMERISETEEARIEILERLAIAAEYRDDATGEHAQRVGRLSGRLAEVIGLPPRDVELIRRAAPLHDVGKIGIPDAILLKPGKLTPEEFEVIKTHAPIGGRILSGSKVPLLHVAEDIALTHHERWDGGGYTGLSGEEIPLVGRIVTVADVYDALINERPYKHAWPRKDALAEMKAQAGRQFDPTVVEAFMSLQDANVRLTLDRDESVIRLDKGA